MPDSSASLLSRAKAWARRLKRDGLTLWFALKTPGTPWYAKALGAFVVGYALSPIDLIPDFIPVLGFLDDVILLPVLIWLTIRLVPKAVLDDCRMKADAWLAAGNDKPRSRTATVVIIVIWATALLAILWWASDGGILL